MKSLVRGVLIHAPVEQVFAYLDDPTHEPDYWPPEAKVQITDVQMLPNGGHAWRWSFRDNGMRVKGASRDLEHLQNERIASRTRMLGIDSITTWMLEPDGDDTDLTLRLDYTSHTPIVGRMYEAMVVKEDKRVAAKMLENLRRVLEAA